MEHHVVRVAVQLLEGQPAGVPVVDLVDGILKNLPRLLRVLRAGKGKRERGANGQR
jgi:hypothetical protein